MWDATSVIIAKRDRQVLPPDAIRWFIQAYTDGVVSDEQASALAMAVFLNGLTDDELSVWTEAMIDTGVRVSHADLGRVTVDKHSTGGVGDKVSLILCPLIAACAPGVVAVPQLGGRGLGHTGGTIDKMESIPGWNPEMSPEAMRTALLDVGAVIAAASGEIAPADKKLYALRDVTGTVASIPLIASSIMSKKIAGGTEHLVLDVKVGRGAFMTNVDDARRLAETMVEIGQRSGVNTVALLTRMDQPLGWAIGNTIEVDESIAILSGRSSEPPEIDLRSSDLIAVTVALADEMLAMTDLRSGPGAAADPRAVLNSGGALGTWKAMVRAQGGDPDAERPRSSHEQTFDAPNAGYVTDLEALAMGIASMRLGAGRARKDDVVALGAGIEILKKPGMAVEAGEPILRLLADDPSRFSSAVELLDGAVTVGPEPPVLPDPIIERIG